MRLGAIAWRGLRARPLRTALAVAGVALGVAIVAATSITTAAADQAVRSAAAELLGRADVRLRAFEESGFTPRTVQTVSGLPGVDAATAVAERRLQVSTQPGRDEQVFTLLVLGVDPEGEPAVRDPHLVEGLPLSPNSPTDALVPADWAARTGLSIGDELLLNGRRQGTRPLRIVGLLDRVGFGALERGEVLVMSREALDAAYEVPSPVRYVDLVVADDVPVADLLAEIDAVMTEPYVVETADDAAARLAAAQASFSGIALLFGLVALVVGGFMVGNTMAMLVGERSREIGLLRAAGTTSRQVLGIVARQAAAIAIGGSLLGLVLGAILAAAMITFLASTRTALAAGLPLPAGGLLLAFGLGIVVTALGAAAPAIAAARLAPLDALRPSTRSDRGLGTRLRWLVVTELLVVALGLVILPLDTGDVPLLPIVLSLGLLVGGAVAAAIVLQPLGAVIGRPFEWFFGAQGLLGRANLSRDRTRTGLSVGALMIALAAVVALGLGLAIALSFGLAIELGDVEGGEPWERLPLLAGGLALAGACVGALGALVGALAREARAASLVSLLVVLPIVFLGLVPREVVPAAGWLSDGLPFAHSVRFFASALYDADPWRTLAVEAAWLGGLALLFGLAARAAGRRLLS
jgi:putative ABC transport system permease protein